MIWLVMGTLPTSDEGGGVPVARAMARSRRLRARAWSCCRILPDPVELKCFAMGNVTKLSRIIVVEAASILVSWDSARSRAAKSEYLSSDIFPV